MCKYIFGLKSHSILRSLLLLMSLLININAVHASVIASGLDGIEFLTTGPGGMYGSDIYVATIGTAARADGAVYTLDPLSRTLTPFLTNLDAVSVAFDTQGVLGGGMFVSDRRDQSGGAAGRIWQITQGGVSDVGAPTLSSSLFSAHLFYDFSSLGHLKAFQLQISSGQNGFEPGMYISSGPTATDQSDRFVFIDTSGNLEILASDLISNESFVFANSHYGTGILLTEPLMNKIVRLDRAQNGTVSVTDFASLGTAPFGPAVLAYDPNGKLFVSDFSGNSVLSVNPDGSSEIYRQFPQECIAVHTSGGSKYIGWTSSLGLIGANFNATSTPIGDGGICQIPEPAPILLILTFVVFGWRRFIPQRSKATKSAHLPGGGSFRN